VEPVFEQLEYTRDDYIVVGAVARFQEAIVSRADLPWDNLGEVLDGLKNSDERVTYGSQARNDRMVLAQINAHAARPLVVVPFSGGPDLRTALLGGHIDLGFSGSRHVPLIKNGELKAMAVIGEERYDSLPDTPTLTELGIPFALNMYSIFAVPAGTLAALALARYRIRFPTGLQLYLLLPFTVPLVVSGIALMLLFGRMGLLGSVWPIGLATCVINLPFMIWAVAASVNHLDPDLENAAMNCGAPPTHTFFTVTLPAVAPGILTGALIMFILAVNEFLVSLMLVDARIVTLPVLVYNAIRNIITPDLAAVSVVYLVIAIAAIWLLDRLVGLDILLKSKRN